MRSELAAMKAKDEARRYEEQLAVRQEQLAVTREELSSCRSEIAELYRDLHSRALGMGGTDQVTHKLSAALCAAELGYMAGGRASSEDGSCAGDNPAAVGASTGGVR